MLLQAPVDRDETERQAHLSLRWETRNVWSNLCGELGLQRKHETTAAVAPALFSEARGQGRWTSYSRSKPHYERPSRYASRLYSYRRVTGAVDALDDLGLIDHDRRLPGRRGWQSSMRPRPELLGIVRPIVEREGLRLRGLREPLLLRGAEKDLVDYRDTRETHRMRRELEAQNEAIGAVGLGTVLTFPSHLRRIFNGDFRHGGRFYAEGGGWQMLSKAERGAIEIDGEPVVEIDYATLHPVLAYARRGRPAPVEAYAIAGFDRPLVKIAFNVSLNILGRSGARHTIARKPQLAEAILGIGSGLILSQGQRITDATRAIAEKKVCGRRS